MCVVNVDKTHKVMYNFTYKYKETRIITVKMKFLAAMLIVCACLSACSSDLPKIKDLQADKKPVQNTQIQVNRSVFENDDFAQAFASILNKSEKDITKEDCKSVRFISVGYNEKDVLTLYIGFEDYSDAYFSEVEKGEAADAFSLMDYVKSAPIDLAEESDISKDLLLFENVEVFELYDVKIHDVSFLNSMQGLYYGYFRNNGITDLSALSGFAPPTLRELDFTDNDIQDWTPVMHIVESIIVNYSVQTFTDADGNKIDIPNTVYLTDLLETNSHDPSSDNSQETEDTGDTGEETDSGEGDGNSSDAESEIVFDEEIDWSVLFE